PFVHSLNENFNKLKESKKITNIHDCRIFASIMNKEFRGIFSIRVEYEDEGTPLIIAHHITMGYPEAFDFDNTEMILRSREHTVSEKETVLWPKKAQ
ncbi:483_t:CDS:2, partial [Racocetra persica]